MKRSLVLSSVALITLPILMAYATTPWQKRLEDVAKRDCATYPGLAEDLYARHLFLQSGYKTALPTTQTRDIGNIAIIEDNGSLIWEDANGLHIDDYGVANAFYATHPDSFDFLLMFRNFDAYMYGFAYHFNVKNNVFGIGLDIFDNSYWMGSAGRLKGFTNQNDINYHPDDPHFHLYRTHSIMTGMLHETMHQWAAFLNNENQVVNSSHWYSFCDTKSNWGNSTTSAMEGYIWTDNGGGDYQGYAYADGLMPLDLYVMGLYDAGQVSDIWYLQNPTVTSPLNIFVPPYYALPIELHASGTPQLLSIFDIINANGERIPDTSVSQKSFNMAFILVVKNGEVPKGEELARIERFRQEFEKYFYASTESLATMNTSLFGSNPIEIVTLELRGAGVGLPYAESLYAVGGTKPYAWNLISGSLPSGLTLSNGFLSGSPSTAGTFNFTVVVQDAGLKADTVNLTLTVSQPGQSKIVINELELWERYNVGAGIELYNKGDSAVDLQNWTMELNGVDGRITYTFPAVVLPPKSFLVLLESKGNNTSSRLFIGEDIAWIYNGSGFCSLKDNSGNGVDFVRFGTSTEPPPTGTSWSGPNPSDSGSVHNLVRDSLSKDTDNSSDWQVCNGNLGRKNLCAANLCLAQPGDVDGTAPISLPDVIYLVNYVFDKDRTATGCLGSSLGNCWAPSPLCRGEINGTPPISLPDVIHLVNYVFDKDRPATGCEGSNPGNCWAPVASDICCQPVP